MITLNEITRKQDNDTFNNYSQRDLRDTFEACTDEEKDGLRKRLAHLEELNANGDDLAVKADGFTDDEYDDFNDQDLFDELLILRSITR